jgi:hypothetical protein
MNIAIAETSMAGRPGKKGAREPNGRLQRGQDRGTAELQRRREWLAAGGDPAKTATPLDEMLTREMICDATHRAASRFAWLHAMLFGRASWTAVSYDGTHGGRAPDDSAEREKWYLKLRTELAEYDACFASRHAYDDVMSLVVFGRAPGWLRPRRLAPHHIAEQCRLLRALDDLAIAAGLKRAGPGCICDGVPLGKAPRWCGARREINEIAA